MFLSDIDPTHSIMALPQPPLTLCISMHGYLFQFSVIHSLGIIGRAFYAAYVEHTKINHC